MVYICAAKNGGEKMLLSSERVDIITLFAKKNKKRNSKKNNHPSFASTYYTKG